jgi:hypothetical protein
MENLKYDLMFDKPIYNIMFERLVGFNQTHILYWLDSRKISYIDISCTQLYYIVRLKKTSKDVQLNKYKLKGENGVIFSSIL